MKMMGVYGNKTTLFRPNFGLISQKLETISRRIRTIRIIAVRPKFCAYIALTSSLALKLHLFEPVGTEAAVKAAQHEFTGGFDVCNGGFKNSIGITETMKPPAAVETMKIGGMEHSGTFL